MAAASSSSKLSMKLLIDTREKRVLFAEADKKAVDFLFHLLTLPLGTVTRLLRDRKMVGGLGNLYSSVENLNETYIQPGETMDVLLKPKVWCGVGVSGPLLAHPDINRTSENASYRFGSFSGSAGKSPQPSNIFQPPPFEDESYSFSGGSEGGFVKGTVTFMVMDDLTVKPVSAIYGVAVLNKFNVTDLGNVEEKDVELGLDEALDLLKASLMSNKVLTTVFLKNAYSCRKV